MTTTVFLSLLILLVGFILRNAIYELKQQCIKEMTMREVSNYLNSHNVIVRDKKLKTHKFRSHVVLNSDKEDSVIIIDI